MNPFALARGALLFLALALTLLLWCVPFLPLALLRPLLRGAALARCRRGLVAVARGWLTVANRLMLASGALRLERTGDFTLSPEGRYLLLCNHRSWSDILVLTAAFGARMPFPRFFAKAHLLWIPGLNLGLWGLDFPIMVRQRNGHRAAEPARRRRDLARAARACAVVAGCPFTLVVFPEGTRWSAAKQAVQSSPYDHLLRPRAGGVGQVLGCLGQRLDAVLDVTLAYARSETSFWQLLCGAGGVVWVAVVRRPVPPELAGADCQRDPAARAAVQDWINGVWRKKDQLLTTWATAARGTQRESG